MKFPYVDLRGRLLPIVPVEVNNIEFYAFVDSGATFSIFHSDIAEILDIKIEDGEKVFVTVGDGSLIPVYLHELRVKFAGKDFNASIGMSKKLGIGFDIIGRKSFFENFKICFDEKNKTVESTEVRGESRLKG